MANCKYCGRTLTLTGEGDGVCYACQSKHSTFTVIGQGNISNNTIQKTMANIFDEAIVIVKCDSQLMDNQELKVMKALKLGKLYKELAEYNGLINRNIRYDMTKEQWLEETARIVKEIEELEK